MKRLTPLAFFFLFLFGYINLQGQHTNILVADSLLKSRGEVFFKFKVGSQQEVNILTRIISIDRVDGLEVFAYANASQFSEFRHQGYAYEILTPPGLLLPEKDLLPGIEQQHPGNTTTIWNFYPSYNQYVSYMVGFAQNHSEICKLDTIGTTIDNRLLLAVRISKNINLEETEPQFFYTSSIHGDEITGYVLMLHLIDYLLSNYGIDPRITNLINTTEIVINPLANPDGTYHGGNNSVSGAVRYNANYVDLNRNYPDPKVGAHPDGNQWQTETNAFMTYAYNNHFTMSANFHGGSEVFNYPWDTWSKNTADYQWWQFVGREWADTVHKYAVPGYFTYLNDGITNGNAWYEINGGRQDYMNYWHKCREVTVEISETKILPTSELLSFWDYNYHSFLNFIEESHYGFSGIVTDSVTGQPLKAKVFIPMFDIDSSEVFSRETNGYYMRPIYEGNYDVSFSDSGYVTKYVKNVQVSKWSSTTVNVQLRPLSYTSDNLGRGIGTIHICPNPNDGDFFIDLPKNVNYPVTFQLYSCMGKLIYQTTWKFQSGSDKLQLSIHGLTPGIYTAKVSTENSVYANKLVIQSVK
ncbi:MAG: M14 family zinc carboxypeptidase [Bacteroidales bacterium]|nr:M14 family zinc carboxypeptidase [Bacteroidales bacterium]